MRTLKSIFAISFALFIGCSKDSDDSSPTGPVNRAPVIQSVQASPAEVPHNGTSSLVCIATDADRDSLTYAWSARLGSISAEGSEARWTAPIEAGQYWVKVIVNDGAALDVDSARITVLQNRPPVIASLTSSSAEVSRGNTATVTCQADDADGDYLRYTWTATSGTIESSGESVQWRAPQTSGAYWIRVAVSDGFDISTDSLQATVLANRPPIIRSLIANPTELVHGANSNLTCIATDDDGNNLTYTWTPRAGTIQGSGSAVQWRAPEMTGKFWIMVAVTDNLEVDKDSVQCIVSPPNEPPSRPFNPYPPTGGGWRQPTYLTITWNCIDPEGDPITYDFYFGSYDPSTGGNPSLIARDLIVSEYRIENLNSGSWFCWKVVAHDNHGNAAIGEICTFRTY